MSHSINDLQRDSFVQENRNESKRNSLDETRLVGSLTVSGKPLDFKSSRFISHSINDFQRDSFVQENRNESKRGSFHETRLV